MPLDPALLILPAALVSGDILLYRPRSIGFVQRRIINATQSPYTHAAIYLGGGDVAEASPRGRQGVVIRNIGVSVAGSLCVGVLRSQCGFGPERTAELRKLIAAIVSRGRAYNFSAVLRFNRSAKRYFGNQLDIIRKTFGTHRSMTSFERESYFCSGLIVAAFSRVGIIDESAHCVYPTTVLSPADLYRDGTFGFTLGYIIPPGGQVPADDPLRFTTLWKDIPKLPWDP